MYELTNKDKFDNSNLVDYKYHQFFKFNQIGSN